MTERERMIDAAERREREIHAFVQVLLWDVGKVMMNADMRKKPLEVADIGGLVRARYPETSPSFSVRVTVH
jgi:hypothetical protein